MERLFTRLERRLGRFALPNLITFIVGGMAIAWILSLSRPEFIERLVLDFGAVLHGEIWRLFTFVFIPPTRSDPSQLLWLAIDLYFTWWVGSSLEQHWGSFKFDAYYALAMVATIAAAAVAGPMTNFWIDGSLFLAFATVFPNVEILLLFVLPIRVKWLGIVAALGFVYEFAVGDTNQRAAIAAAVLAYGVFFAAHWWGIARERRLVARQRARRVEFARADAAAPVFGHRVCAICGAREADGVDVRVCSCEKCGGKPRTLCLEHARNH